MKRSQGFSLIELLVAVLIMAVGILGVAGLQVVSLQQNRSALLRAQAVQLANDLADRIRVNSGITYSAALADDPLATAKDCVAVSCNTIEMYQFDVAQWKCSINSTDSSDAEFAICQTFGITGALPQGQGAIAKTGDLYSITVRWADDRAGNFTSIDLPTRVN